MTTTTSVLHQHQISSRTQTRIKTKYSTLFRHFPALYWLGKSRFSLDVAIIHVLGGSDRNHQARQLGSFSPSAVSIHHTPEIRTMKHFTVMFTSNLKRQAREGIYPDNAYGPEA